MSRMIFMDSSLNTHNDRCKIMIPSQHFVAGQNESMAWCGHKLKTENHLLSMKPNTKNSWPPNQ